MCKFLQPLFLPNTAILRELPHASAAGPTSLLRSAESSLTTPLNDLSSL